LPEKDYTYGEQLLLEAVKSTYGIPTVGVLAAGFLGVQFALPRFGLLLKTLEQIGADIVRAAKEIAEEKIMDISDSTGISAAAKLAADAQACYIGSRVTAFGVPLWIPGYSETQFNLCMGKKGYAGETVKELLNRFSV